METSLPGSEKAGRRIRDELPEGLEPPTGKEAFAIIQAGGILDLGSDCT